MANSDYDRCVFPLTNLQIGDLQSYLSHLSLFMPHNSGSLYILVDNRPWVKDLASRPTQLWQLMVTKSRLSPFANTRGRKERKMTEELSELQASSSSNTWKLNNFKKWFSLIDALMLSKKRALLPVKKLRNSLIANSKLHRTLYGFIVFEVAWSHVRGINYLNELQTATSLAVEARVMRRWEFDSIAQAARLISSWFPGALDEQILLEDYLYATLGEVFQDARESYPRTEDDTGDYSSDEACSADESPRSPSNNFGVYRVKMGNGTDGLLTPPPPDGHYKRRKVMRSIYHRLGISSGEADSETVDTLSQSSDLSDFEEILEPTLYRDVLILIRFEDHDLPFKLREIIMPDLRLLTLLEAGLPSWVIFLQSYPLFCHLYRPWMCPLARALYVLMSFVTVLVGFYDLYKNVPLLKATASRLFGPLFDWIETLEMISRIKYLGTMLFLHNSQKTIKWFLKVARTTRSCLSFILHPMGQYIAKFFEIFLPLSNVFIQVIANFFSVIWAVVETSFTVIGDVLEILVFPLWYGLLILWNVAFAAILILWEVVYAPVRLVVGLYRAVALSCKLIYSLVGDVWVFTSSIFSFTRDVETTVSAYEVSIWRSLWNDLFSRVFRALRSILNGFVAFFAACNRHRLSIYNHIKELLNQILSCKARRASSEKNSQTGSTSEVQLTLIGKEECSSLMMSKKNR